MRNPQLPLLLLALFFFQKSTAQDCPASAQTDLDANLVTARMMNGGGLWWDGSDAKYIVPNDHPDQVSAIFAGGFWLGGFDPAGNLKLGATTYGPGGGGGIPGPLVNGAIDNELCASFNRFWVVKRSEINAHLADFADNGVIDDPILRVVGWAGRGNPEHEMLNDFELPDMGLAPFNDLDGDGIYEPLDGEYPKIKGDHGVWWMFTYAGGANFLSPNVTFSVLAQSFEGSGDVISTTTYYDVQLLNAGLESLDSTYFGLWVDADLGCYADDFIGSWPAEDMAFIYNEEAIDGIVGCDCFGVPTYCEEVPILGIKFLQGVTDSAGEDLGMSSFMYYSNPSAGNPGPPPGTTDPVTIEGFYNLLAGHWPDGEPLTAGGDGYMDGAPTTHAFAGNPANVADWTMCSEQLPSRDQRLLLNSGPFEMASGSRNSVSFAVIWLPDVPDYPCPDIMPLVEAAQYVEEYCENLTPAVEVAAQTGSVTVSPNPFHHQLKMQAQGGMLLQTVNLFSVDGKLLRSYNGLNASELMIHRGDLPHGILLFEATLSDGRLATGKVVSR